MKSDIWSLGCVLYEMMTLLPPFRAKDISSLMKKVCSGVYAPPPSKYSDDLIRVISSCLKTDTKERLSANKLLRLPEVVAKMAQLNM